MGSEEGALSCFAADRGDSDHPRPIAASNAPRKGATSSRAGIATSSRRAPHWSGIVPGRPRARKLAAAQAFCV